MIQLLIKYGNIVLTTKKCAEKKKWNEGAATASPSFRVTLFTLGLRLFLSSCK